jgi:DNA repair protein RecN (Recombination protein N)
MLTHLCISNFTTVASCDLELPGGLSVITGETGAGKSVMLDALAMALGDRSSTSILRDEKRNAEISASFQIEKNSNIYQWLNERDLTDTETDNEVILRRVITPAGRSRAYINGVTASIADLRYIGEQLVDLHNQHEHQSLLDPRTHPPLLDNFGKQQKQQRSVADLARQWQQLEQQLVKLRESNAAKDARVQLLSYQVQELDKLALQADEAAALASEQKKLANAETLMHSVSQASLCCDNDEASGAISQLKQATTALKQQLNDLPELAPCIELLESASIQVEEAHADLSACAEQLIVDPQRLQTVESRLDSIYSIARKHQVEVDALFDLHQQLSLELADLEGGDAKIEALVAEQQHVFDDYISAAKKLSKQRGSAAKKLARAVNQKLAELQMEHCQFGVECKALDSNAPATQGLEAIEFLISTIPGKPAAPLAKIASGGELSRISLAIAVVTAQTSNIPTLVFDEVDVGIGGGVAEVVGSLLRELGEAGQVFCVTHLAQVAAKGNTHLLAQKTVSKTTATTAITALDNEGRTAELARMMGGLDVTQSSLAHATEMLESA